MPWIAETRTFSVGNVWVKRMHLAAANNGKNGKLKSPRSSRKSLRLRAAEAKTPPTVSGSLPILNPVQIAKVQYKKTKAVTT
jgi:hypothetical protein